MKASSAIASTSALLAGLWLSACAAEETSADRTGTSLDRRVADLLARMSVQEKMAQLIQGDMGNFLNVTDGSFNQTGLVWNMANRANSIWTGYYAPLENINKAAKIAQDYLVHNTTNSIPAFIQSEGLHGLVALNATIFNSPIGMGCSFNPELVRKMAAAIGQESAALGINQLFAPNVDLARELRFGRVEETFGEDPHLVGEMAHAYVVGLQSQNVSAMVKHFAAFASPEQGLNTAAVNGGERELRSIYLPPFKRAIIDGGAASIMSSYNSYDGIPAVSNPHTLTDILRGEWGYKNYVISDAGGTARLDSAFHVCAPKDDDCIVMETLPAGNDAEMGGGYYSFQQIPKLIQSGKLEKKVLDTAVSRVLRAKLAMGLFDKPYTGVPNDQVFKYINTKDTRDLARQLDSESIVLLENRGNTLPLKRDANVAVIGPMAHGYVNYGDYVIHTAMSRGVTPFDGIKAASKGTVTFTQGCQRWSNDDSGFDAAVAAAKAADVAVVVVGTWSRDQNELWSGFNATTGEHIDVSDLNLVGSMPRLVRAVVATGKPTVVVFSSGKPVTEPWISDHASALVQQFYQSEEGGHALADVLYGDVNPSGKLSVSFPYDVGTLPIYYNHVRSSRLYPNPGHVSDNGTLTFGSSYVLQKPTALYSFGYGLSYSSFSFSAISASSATTSRSGTVTVSVDVENQSDRDGSEVVQIYLEDVIASVDIPQYQLKAFQKVSVKAKSKVTAKLELQVGDWGLWNKKMAYVVEPGQFVLHVGNRSDAFKGSVNVTIV